ncbi:hypothetical protein LQ764DRAFT_102941 [Zygosaccharomyces rouxii]|nr:hypothetical protein LQ764DRAFT_102941 [Zygosaccharomyces rouxii]
MVNMALHFFFFFFFFFFCFCLRILFYFILSLQHNPSSPRLKSKIDLFYFISLYFISFHFISTSCIYCKCKYICIYMLMFSYRHGCSK